MITAHLTDRWPVKVVRDTKIERFNEVTPILITLVVNQASYDR